MSNINDRAKEALFGGTGLCKEHGNVAKACPYCRIDSLERQLAVSEELRLSGCEVIDQEQAKIAELEKENALLREYTETEFILAQEVERLEQQYNSLTLQLNEAVFRESTIKAQNTKLTTALELIVSTMRNRGSLSYAYIADCMAGIAADTLEGMKGE